MIIALKGPSQSGKSTLAKGLAEVLQAQNYEIRRTAFGDAVREELANWLSLHSKGIFDSSYGGGDLSEQEEQALHKHADKFMSGREFWKGQGTQSRETYLIAKLSERPASESSRWLQQWWGQDYRRKQDPYYWVKKSFTRNVDFLLADTPNRILIEESCRQPNEGAYVHALGGVVVDLAPLLPPTEAEHLGRTHAVEQIATSWTGDCTYDMAHYFSLSPEGQNHHLKSIVDYVLWLLAQSPAERDWTPVKDLKLV